MEPWRIVSVLREPAGRPVTPSLGLQLGPAGRPFTRIWVFSIEERCAMLKQNILLKFVFGSLVLFARSGQMTDSMGLAMIWNVASLNTLAAKTNYMSPSSLVLCF